MFLDVLRNALFNLINKNFEIFRVWRIFWVHILQGFSDHHLLNDIDKINQLHF